MHTPHSWTIDDCPDAYGFDTIRRADGSDNGDLEAPAIATVYDYRDSSLIAAAPELLAALQRMVYLFEPLQNDPEGRTAGGEACLIARAAIARATGEA